jgi:hypothetical protein
MNCSDLNPSNLTSSNGNRNAKRNQGAANCGARTKHHHHSSIDFLDRRFPMPQNMVKQTPWR